MFGISLKRYRVYLQTDLVRYNRPGGFLYLSTISFQYLDENPDAVLDAGLMSGLNTMATNLVERTFEDRAASVRCIKKL